VTTRSGRSGPDVAGAAWTLPEMGSRGEGWAPPQVVLLAAIANRGPYGATISIVSDGHVGKVVGKEGGRLTLWPWLSWREQRPAALTGGGPLREAGGPDPATGCRGRTAWRACYCGRQTGFHPLLVFGTLCSPEPSALTTYRADGFDHLDPSAAKAI